LFRATSTSTINSGRTERETRVDYCVEKTYRCRGEDEFIKRAARPQEPALEAATGCGLFILIDGRVRLESGCPREVGKVRDPHVTFRKLRQLGRVRALPDLLDLWGGDPHYALENIVFLRSREGRARCGRRLFDKGGGPRRRL
jgi:hypothetical protein